MQHGSTWVVLALATILASVLIAIASSQNGTRLSAETAARLRSLMMRSILGSSPRAIAALGEELSSAPPPNVRRPPGVALPKTMGADAVKLTVLRDAQSSAEFLIAGLVTLPQAIVALVALAFDLVRSGAVLVAIGGAAIFVLSRVASLRASRGVSRATAALQATDARVFGEVGEKIGHVEDFRLAGAKAKAQTELDQALADAVAARRGFARALALSSQVTTVLGAMAPLLVLLVLSLSGRTPAAGEVAKLLLAIPVLVARLQAIDALRVGSIEKSVVLASVSKVIDLPPLPDPSRARVGADAVKTGKVEFDGVTFVPHGKDTPILHDVSLEIPPASVVGLCGPSGSGKSTLLRLLLRLDDPTKGGVLIDGADVREIHVDELPRVFSRLGQESKLLGRSIEENVLLGAPKNGGDPRDAAKKALERAQIPELATEEGLARRFTAAPPNLSGGEQRRVLFARALAQDAKVLVLDEPEAGLPGGQVEAVLRAAVEAAKGKTLFIATHAPDLLASTFNVLLENGRVVDRGSHAELLERSEKYRRLFSRKADGSDSG
jgi:ABC-type multidrug transport system fused ATPase/permease subunit